MILPGTTIDTGNDEQNPEKYLDMIFMAGGLTLSQIEALGSLSGHDIQNWIKRGFCPPPSGKKYTKGQFCRLVTINLLKDVMPLGDIVSVLSYVNGRLDDTRDDIIPDDLLYCLFVRSLEHGGIADYGKIENLLMKYTFRNGEDCRRICRALVIIGNAYESARYKSIATEEMKKLKAI